MEESILLSLKPLLVSNVVDDSFDTNLIFSINAAISNLIEFGIGPEQGFEITGDTEKWSDLIGPNVKLASAKNYVYLKTKLMFDPPSNSFLVDIIKSEIAETEWRLVNKSITGGADNANQPNNL